MTWLHIGLGFVLGVLGTLRITVAVVRRIRKEMDINAYHRGYEVGFKAGKDLPHPRAPEPGASI